MPFRSLQGEGSATFHRPPLDGTLTVPEIFDKHVVHSPTHPLFVFTEQNGDIRHICYPEGVSPIHGAAHIISKHYRRLPDKHNVQRKHGRHKPVIGILAVADTVTVFSLIVGVMRLGYVAFPISTRNSAIAVAHLISEANVIQLFVIPDPAMQRLSADALTILAARTRAFEALAIPHFEDIYMYEAAQRRLSL